MFIIHMALGGCLKAAPVDYGITADTGGHIAYILEAAHAQAAMAEVDHVSIVTRLFDDAILGTAYSRPSEKVAKKLYIDRIATSCRTYLEKGALGADIPAFIDAFCKHLGALPRLPDVIHAHFADAAVVAMAVQQRLGIPFVYTPHALGFDKFRQGLSCKSLDARITAERAAIASAGAIIVSTQDEGTRQIGNYGVFVGDRVHCLPPGVPHRDLKARTATIADCLGDWFDDPELPILLAVARPVAKKNLAALVRAYVANGPLQRLANLVILAGQHDHAIGEERVVLDELIALASHADLKGKIALPPRHDTEDVAGLYRRAADGGVFVNPALHEPFGLTVIEAAAAGVPVVVTHNGGPTEIVATLDHGILVDPRDDAAIGDACRCIVSDTALHARLAESARAGIHRFSWDRYATSSIKVYRTSGQPRLLASDIDNTLTGCADGARAFSAWAAKHDMPFVVATGRSFDDARRVLEAWELPKPDAYIVDVGTRIMLQDEEGQWQACQDYAAMLDRNWDRDAVARALADLPLEPQPSSTQTCHKMSFFGDPSAADAIRRVLAKADIAASVVFSHGRLIDILPPSGGKAAAIAAYAVRLGLPLSACMAAGDSGNDIDMLTACGHAIIVANADDDVADLPPRPGLYRTIAPHAAGVLEGLAHYGLAEQALQVAA